MAEPGTFSGGSPPSSNLVCRMFTFRSTSEGPSPTPSQPPGLDDGHPLLIERMLRHGTAMLYANRLGCQIQRWSQVQNTRGRDHAPKWQGGSPGELSQTSWLFLAIRLMRIQRRRKGIWLESSFGTATRGRGKLAANPVEIAPANSSPESASRRRWK